jgi:hypothetical protein
VVNHPFLWLAEAIISCTAEKVSVIELIHLPEVLHFVELTVIGKPDYYADRHDYPAGLFLAPHGLPSKAPETDRK